MKSRDIFFLLANVLIVMVLMAALGCAAVFAEEEGFDGSYELDAPYDEGSEIPAAFQGYVHDPMQNPNAAKDIIVNPDAVYGYSPSPDSVRLAPFLEYDLTDLAVVEELKKQHRRDRRGGQHPQERAQAGSI